MNERRSSLRIPQSHRDSVTKRPPSKAPSDADLVVKYIDKLNEVLEEKNILDKKIKEQEQLISNMQKNPKKFFKNFKCEKCNFHQMEIEDYLNQLLNLKNKFNKLQKQNKNLQAGKLNKNKNLCITNAFKIEFYSIENNKNHFKSIEALRKENFSLEIQRISINKASVI